jgi:hypothetical protein
MNLKIFFMKKEQIDLMIGLQKAIENRQNIVKTLKNMFHKIIDKKYSLSSFNIILSSDDYYKISEISDREEFKEQVEFLLNFHQVKLEQQQQEIESYILSKKIE